MRHKYGAIHEGKSKRKLIRPLIKFALFLLLLLFIGDGRLIPAGEAQKTLLLAALIFRYLHFSFGTRAVGLLLIHGHRNGQTPPTAFPPGLHDLFRGARMERN